MWGDPNKSHKCNAVSLSVLSMLMWSLLCETSHVEMCLYGILKFCEILCRHLAHTGCLVLMFLDQFSESINVKCILSCLWPLLSNDISMKELPLCVKILICVIGVSASLSFFLCHVLIFLMMFCVCTFLK